MKIVPKDQGNFAVTLDLFHIRYILSLGKPNIGRIQAVNFGGKIYYLNKSEARYCSTRSWRPNEFEHRRCENIFKSFMNAKCSWIGTSFKIEELEVHSWRNSIRAYFKCASLESRFVRTLADYIFEEQFQQFQESVMQKSFAGETLMQAASETFHTARTYVHRLLNPHN